MQSNLRANRPKENLGNMSSRLLAKSSIIRVTTTMAIVAALACVAMAQYTPPCQPLPDDRTITWCYPIDNATFGAFTVNDTGYIKDSLPHTAKEYLDGQYYTGVPDIWSGGTGQNWDDKIHTFTIVVTDSLGTFQKSVSFRQSAQLPCSSPSSDRSMNFCIPLEGETTTSPLRVAAVARSSIGVSWLQVWVDGVKYWTEHYTGTATQKLMNNYVYLPNGNHSVTMIAKELDGTSIKKTVHVQIVSNP
jgi:hypothetical protein